MDQPDPSVFRTREFWDERYGDRQIWSGEPNTQLVHCASDLPPGVAHLPEVLATGEQMAAVLDPAAWTITTAAPDRPGADADGNAVTLHDAVLRAVRR